VHDGLVSVLAVPKMCVQFVVTVVTVAQETSRVDYIRTGPRNLRTGFVRRRKCLVWGYCQYSNNPPVPIVCGVGLLSRQ